MIYLLDLNYTLVANSHEKHAPFAEQIRQETYRDWLVALLRSRYVILMTARPVKYRDLTLESIQAKTGWNPNEAYFNSYRLPPPQAKERMLREFVLPPPGRKAAFTAIESNPATHAMYARFGIVSHKINDNQPPWTTLPA